MARLVASCVVALGLALLGCGALAFYARVIAQDSLLRRLMPPSGDAEAGASTVVSGRATMEALSPGGLGPCLVSFERSEEQHFVTTNDGTRVRFDDGRTYFVAEPEPMTFADNEPPRRRPGADLVATAEARARRIADGKEYRFACLDPTEPVFVQACLAVGTGNQLVRCPGDEAIPMAAGGSPKPLVQIRVADGMTWLFVGLVGWLVAAVSAWLLCAFARPIVGKLGADRVKFALFGMSWFLLLAVASGAAILSLALWSLSIGPFVTAFCALWVCALLMGLLVMRLRVLFGAVRALRSTEPSPLHDVETARRVLVVRVSSDASAVEGIAGATVHAFVRAVVTEQFVVESSSGEEKTIQHLTRAVTVDHPLLVPIEDASGRGLLEVKDCLVDVAAEPDVAVKDSSGLPPWLAERVKLLPGHESFSIEWRALDAVEPLIVLGETRSEGSTAESSTTSGYRGAPKLPLVRGPGAAFVGTASDIDRGVSVEIGALLVLAALHAAAMSAVVVGTLRALVP